jgi:hypothetical protein
MRKFYLLFLLISFTSLNKLSACEICGCSTGNFYLGLLPKFNNKFIGVRYRSMNYRTLLKQDPTQFSNDYYSTIEIWSGWNLGKKWQVMAFVPFQMNRQITDDGNNTNSGLGDITLLTNYNIWNRRASIVSHQLWIGGGVKLPTGQYKVSFDPTALNLGQPNGQIGTGSVDYLLSINHNASYMNWGLSTSVNYKVNTANTDQFKFGNRATANMLVYYRVTHNSFNVAPTIGGFFEQSNSNSYQSSDILLTGGHALFATTGLEMSYSRIAFGISLQAPLAQNYSDHQTTAQTRGLTHLTFTF